MQGQALVQMFQKENTNQIFAKVSWIGIGLKGVGLGAWLQPLTCRREHSLGLVRMSKPPAFLPLRTPAVWRDEPRPILPYDAARTPPLCAVYAPWGRGVF